MTGKSWVRWALASSSVVIILLLVSRLLLVAARMPLDFNEGWNAFHARDALRQGALYPARDALTVNNYPPLSFVLLAWLGKPFGDLIVVGRVVSLVALAAVALGAHRLVRIMVPASREAAWFAVVLFLAFDVTIFRGYIGINDPQWLAHALMMGSFVLLAGPGPDARLSRSRAFASAVLVAAGVLTKHNLVAYPAAAGLWLLLHDRRAFLIWCAVAGVTIAGLLVADRTVFAGNMLAAILGTPRTHSWSRLLRHGLLVLLLLPMLGAVWPLLRLRARDRRIDLLLFGLALALPLGVIQGGGLGVDVNAYFEATIFLAIAVPVGFALHRANGGSTRVALALTVLPLLLALPWSARTSLAELRERSADIALTRAATARIAAIPGPVACEMASLCYWAGKDYPLDYFLYNQRILHAADPRPLLDAVRRRHLAAFQIEGPAGQDRSEPIQGAVKAGHKLLWSQPGRAIFAGEPEPGR